jgi:two-component system, NarL family, response regulator DevR
MDRPIRLFILSDNRLFREALTRIFSKKTDIETLRSCEFRSDPADELVTFDPDVVLLDSAPALSSQIARLARIPNGKRIKIVMVAMNDDEDVFLDVVRQGVYGYVAREASAMELVNAVRAVAQGEAVCPPRLCKRLFDLVADQWTQREAQATIVGIGLTRREGQMIPLIDLGLTNKEIAARLNLSEKTVKNHIHRILRKLGAENRFALAAACRASRNSPREGSVAASPPPA